MGTALPASQKERPVLGRDVVAAAAVTVLTVPQAMAYATIAGLPPVVGLYAGCVPAIVGALARSSRHVVTGPSNAVSLLVGSVIAARTATDPMTAALTLALLAGLVQLGAGLLRLGVLVDYISGPVVTGYITGAAVLIAIGQRETLLASPAAVGFGVGTAALILGLRLVSRRIPGPLVALGAATLLAALVDFPGLVQIGDVAPLPGRLPPLTLPEWRPELLTAAAAVAVLSLVESSAVARSIAATTRQPLDLSREFVGQGLANVAAAFTSGYPVSGSLARSSANLEAGATSRLAGVLSGVFTVLVVLFLGRLVDPMPMAALAGLLVVVALDLVDPVRIRTILRGRLGDAAAFLGTTIGTWVLELDEAIYLGVAISLVLYLRRARMLTVTEMIVDAEGRVRERGVRETPPHQCPAIHILHVEGQVFFAAAGELEAALEDAVRDPHVKVLIVRLRRAHNLDVTVAEVLESTALRLAQEDRHLLLVGVRPQAYALLERTKIAESLGEETLFPARPGWFVALGAAVRYALDLVGDHEEHCPMERYVARRASAEADAD